MKNFPGLFVLALSTFAAAAEPTKPNILILYADHPERVAYLSQFMTLLPADVISTGTPAGVGLGQKPPIYLKPGDIIELGIDGLGTQRQTARAWTARELEPFG